MSSNINQKRNGTSLVAKELKNSKWHVAPGPNWLFKDKLLGDIYDERYPIEEE